MNCDCPDEDELQQAEDSGCAFNLDQLQRFILVKTGTVIWDSATGGAGTEGVPQVDSQADTYDDWALRFAATDNTKMVISPLVGGDPVIAPGDAITKGGGDNSTLNGVVKVTGKNPSTFTTRFDGLTAQQERALQSYGCKDTEIYFVNENGEIIAHSSDGTLGGKITGFPMQEYFCSDRGNNGFAEDDVHNVSLKMKKGWSNYLVKFKPADFNPLTDL